MKLAVIGAGVVGVTTAYALTQDGHQVTVFERCSTAAEGASFANTGLLAPEWMGALSSEEHAFRQKPAHGAWRKWFDRAKPPPDTADPGPAV
jgi:glycine/D-amino acid oxidase-like deaminating enzyme